MTCLTRKQYKSIIKALETNPNMAKEFKNYTRELYPCLNFLPLIESYHINVEKLLDIKLQLTKDELDKVNKIINK
jgi:hypothetical protein